MRKNRIRKVKAEILIIAIVCTVFSGVPERYTVGEQALYTVEAKTKKDKKKPVFKNFGKTKITVEKGKLIKIPKVTAKDNKDGNVTKKIKLKVVCKKNNKRIKSIEKNILKGKAVKFNTVGEHELTYSVADKAGNKATKKKIIIVEDSKKKTTEEPTAYVVDPTTEQPTTEQPTTEQPTTEKVTTEEKTTEKPTPQNPTVEKPTMPNMSDYGTMESVTVNGIKYNILKVTDSEKYYDEIYSSEQTGKFSSDKIIASYIGFDSSICNYSKNHKYLEFFGNLKVVDSYGVDCSNNIFIVEQSNNISFYYINSKGKFKNIIICTLASYDFVKESGNYTYIDYENKICINGEIFGEEYL